MFDENDTATHYRFFDDPRTVNGIFTYENIDPLCISIIDEKEIQSTEDMDKYFKPVIKINRMSSVR